MLPQSLVNALRTPFLMEAVALFNRWKLLKALPHGGGTMDERETVLEILEVLEDENNGFDSWYQDNKDSLVENTVRE